MFRQLLVTMSIFKAITNECKRDVGLFTKMLLSAVREALACLPNDLEVQARVASLVRGVQVVRLKLMLPSLQRGRRILRVESSALMLGLRATILPCSKRSETDASSPERIQSMSTGT